MSSIYDEAYRTKTTRKLPRVVMPAKEEQAQPVCQECITPTEVIVIADRGRK